jgi:cell division protein FtsW (lipid II flippase)
MTLGLLPIAAIALPFVSHGGRDVLYLAMVGLVLSIFRRKELALRSA